MHCLQRLKQSSGTEMHHNLAVTSDVQQCGIWTSVDSDEPVQPPFKLINLK